MTPRLIALLALFAALVGFGLWSFDQGYDAATASFARDMAEAQQAAFEAADLASRKEADRLAAETARAALEQELEDAATADPITDDACFPLGRVLRLNAR